MNDERKKILDLLAEGKIDVEAAERLLDAVGRPTPDSTRKTLPKYLRVVVEGEKQVNVRIPVQLLKSGIQLGALLPNEAQEKVGDALEKRGISLDLKGLKGDQIDEFLLTLAELEVNVDDGQEKVRVFCE